jgi:serine/threonine protein kinase
MPVPRVDLRPSCPDTLILHKWLHDELAREEAASVEEHVGTCPFCQQALDRLGGGLSGLLFQSPGKPGDPEDGEPPHLSGYEPLGQIGAGGMGVVWRVRDVQFQRTLAIKVMKARACNDANAVRRFLAEARITGQLTHPFIVPIHAMGRLPDNRPYYTMKLVEGQTLAELLHDRPDPESRRKDCVPIFLQVCQAVAFAHSRGIIHRDLKPANVMVGPHGEVQVMDWGLAKVLTEFVAAHAETANGLETVDEAPHEDGDNTRTGSVLGTLAYMPPEQARGHVSEVDRRSDVFGLGAILCEILTGASPYTEQDARAVMSSAKEARLDGARSRLRSCGAEPELIQLAERCLVPRKSDRPADAGEVARALDEHQKAVEERLRQAERLREKAEIQAAEQRKRRRVLTVAGGVLVAVLGAGISGTGIGLGRAWQATQRAEKAEDDTLADYRASTDDVVEHLIESNSVLEKDYLEKTLRRWQAFADRAGTDARSQAIRAEGLERVAFMLDKLGRREEALPKHMTALDLRRKLAAANPGSTAYKADLARCHYALGILLRNLQEWSKASPELQTALDLRRELAADDTTAYLADLAQSHGGLGGLFFDLARVDKPRRALHLERARAEFQRAIDLRYTLTPIPGDMPSWQLSLAKEHTSLGMTLIELQKWGDARIELGRALDLGRKLVDTFRDDPRYQEQLASTHHNLGFLFASLSEWDKAHQEYRNAIDLREKLMNNFGFNRRYPAELAGTYCNVAFAIEDAGNPAGGVEWYNKAIQMLTPLYQKGKKDTSVSQYLWNSHMCRGMAYDKLNEHDKAVKDWDEAILRSPKPEHEGLRASRAYSRLRAGMVTEAEAVAEVAELSAPGVSADRVATWADEVWYRCACIYAIAGSKIASKKQEYEVRAMELLQRAVLKGWSDVARAAKDRNLDPLREREDFRQLLKKME